MEHKELTEKVIGCAFKVYNRMGFGFLESVYQKCMMIELPRAGPSGVEIKRKLRELPADWKRSG